MLVSEKETSQSFNYGSYTSPKYSYLNDEDNFDIFYINNNNETEPVCIFDENLGNFDQPDDIVEIIDNRQLIESTETLSYEPFYQYVMNYIVSRKALMRYLYLLSACYWK